jgi:long-chain acyl-CoA synthetase
MHPTIHAARMPGKPAYIMAGSGEVVTYAQLDDRTNQGAQLFRSIGLRAGDHIAILMENDARFLEVCWAAQRSGLIFTAISTHLSPDEATYILDNCDAILLIASQRTAGLASAACARAFSVKHRLMVNGDTSDFVSYEKSRDEQPARPILDERAGIDMLYSSGTTGRPKGVTVEYDPKDITTIQPALRSLITMFNFTADAIYLSTAPLYHAAPLRFNMMTMFQGGTAIIMEKFDAATALDLIRDYRITHSQWVPIMFSRMLALADSVRQRADVSSMRYAIHAAAPCPVAVKQAMIDWWGPILYEYYGSTEAVGISVITSSEWLTHQGSVGRAIVGKARIVDEQTGQELPIGQTGALYFSDGPGVKYHKDPEKTASIRNEKGWYCVGDIAYLDEEGYIYLTDRKAFMIISGGVNIYPQETEHVLMNHPKVADVAVIGVPNTEFGEEVKAVIQLREYRDACESLAAELIQFCRERISHIKCPRSIDFMERLPRLDNGKLYKQKLKERYATHVPLQRAQT